MSLRICHLGKYYPPAPGGIETHVQTLARSQAVAGAEVKVICINHCDRQDSDVTSKRFAKAEAVHERDGAVHVTRLQRRASVARFDVCPGQGFVFKQCIANFVQLLAVGSDNFLRPFVGFKHKPLDLAIDQLGSFL